MSPRTALPGLLPLLPALALFATVGCTPDSTKDEGGGDEAGTTDGADGGGLDGSDGGADGGADGSDGTDGTDGTDGGGGKADCQVALELGVWLDDSVFDVGLLTTTPYTDDAGLAAVAAAIPNDGDEAAGLSLPITGATVVNVGYAPSGATPDLYLQDASGALMTYRITTDAAVKPGDKVNLTVTEAKNYFSTREITAATDFSIVSSGNPIYYNTGWDTSLDYATMGMQNVHVWGELVSDEGDCGGGYTCFTLQHGTQSVVYRINLENLGDYPDKVGDCVDIFAPLGTFSGAPQLNISNYDWRWVSY